MDEDLFPVGIGERGPKVVGARAALQPDIGRAELAPAHRDEVRGEVDQHLLAGGLADLLLDLGHVPVLADRIG